jgi:hypothetical protein
LSTTSISLGRLTVTAGGLMIGAVAPDCPQPVATAHSASSQLPRVGQNMIEIRSNKVVGTPADASAKTTAKSYHRTTNSQRTKARFAARLRVVTTDSQFERPSRGHKWTLADSTPCPFRIDFKEGVRAATTIPATKDLLTAPGRADTKT